MNVIFAKHFVRVITVIVFLCFLSLLNPFIHHSQAQTYPPTTNSYLPPTNPDVPRNDLHALTQGVILEFLSTVACSLSGVNLLGPKAPCLGIDTQSGKLGVVTHPVGLTNFMAGLITPLFIAPIHTGDYTQYLAQSWAPAKKTYAATTGVGFNGLNPLLKVWVGFRNIVYLFFVIIFVVLGLGIILRIKLDAKTAMTVQNVIPKVVIGIILVTFSFAIAGFMIDLMYVVTYLVVYVVAPLDPGAFSTGIAGIDPKFIFANLNRPPMSFVDGLYSFKGPNLNPLGPLSGNLFADWSVGLLFIPFMASLSIAGIMAHMLSDSISNNAIVQAMPGSIILEIMFGVANFPCILGKTNLNLIGFHWPNQGDFTDCAIQGIIPLASVILFIILYIILLFTLFKLWIELIKSYAYFLFDVILGPFWIALGVLPGSSIDFFAWLKSIIANLAVYPATIFMLLISKVIIDTLYTQNGALFIPPLVGNLTAPSTFGLVPTPASFLGAIIGFAIILMTPHVVQMVKESIKAPTNKHAGSAIGEAIAIGPAAFAWGKNAWAPQTQTSSGGWARQAWSKFRGDRNKTSRQQGGPGTGI